MAGSDGFLTRIATYDAANRPPPPVPPSNGISGHTPDGRRYALAALRDEALRVSTATQGTRNDTLNRAMFNVAGFVTAGTLSADEVDATLTTVAHEAGLGGAEVRATLASARRGSAEKIGARHTPELRPDVVEINGHTPPGDEQADLHRIAVTRRAYELRVNDEAHIEWAAQRAAALGQQPPPVTPLPDLLAQPDEDTRYRVDGLLPVGGRALLAAQYKAGKTSMIANLLRSLADGDPFLGHYTTTPVSRVALIDTELDEGMLRRWLRDQNIRTPASVATLCLRGKLSTFGIIDDHTRAQWAARLAGTDFIILDCLRPCLDALGLSEDKDAGIFLTAFDALCKECGAGEATVVHHMGHTQERSRGDSRLLDWPDVLWKIVRDTDDEGNDIESGDRFFSAIGRDVSVAEAKLDWTPETRTLAICGGGRAEKKARNAIADIIDILSDPANADGLSQNRLVAKLKALGNSRNAGRRAVQLAVEEAVLLTTPGPGTTVSHILSPTAAR